MYKQCLQLGLVLYFTRICLQFRPAVDVITTKICYYSWRSDHDSFVLVCPPLIHSPEPDYRFLDSGFKIKILRINPILNSNFNHLNLIFSSLLAPDC